MTTTHGLSRRRFLKIAGAGAGVAAAGGSVGTWLKKGAAATLERGVRQVPTYCDICFWKCGAIATVRDGVLWKIEGNPADPLEPRPALPARHRRRRRPLRLRPPAGAARCAAAFAARRSGPRSRGTRRSASSPRRCRRSRREHGPEAVALFSHGIGGTFLKHTLKAFGTPNIAAPSFAQCRGPRDVGFKLTFGEEVGSPERTDIRNARCLVLIGSHLGENMHNTQVQEFAEAVGAGATIIVVDPRFSIAASKAKYYLPIKPGTDLALLLAWMNVLVTEGLYDKDYVAAHGFGFEAFAAEIAPFTPEWAYPETGIEPEVIRETAREMARHRPATLVHPGPPRHLVRRRHAAQPRDRAAERAARELGAEGRLLRSPSAWTCPAYPYPPYPKSEQGQGRQPGQAVPLRDRDDHHRHPRGDDHRPAVPDQGLVRLRHEPDPRAAQRAGDDPGDPDPRPARRGRRHRQRDRRLGRRRAARGDVSRALRRAERRVVPRAVRGPAPAGRASRPPTRSPTGGSRASWPSSSASRRTTPGKTIEEYLDHRLTGAGPQPRARSRRRGSCAASRKPVYFEEGVAADVPDPVGQDRVLLDAAQGRGLRPRPEVPAPAAAGPPGSFRLLFGRAPVHSFSRTQTNPILARQDGGERGLGERERRDALRA